MRALFLLFCGLMSAIAAPVFAAGNWAPDAKTIAALEAQIRTPAHTPSPFLAMEEYARFYIGVTLKGRHMIRGELVQSPRECLKPKHDPGLYCEYRPGVHLGEELPGIMDGGCSIVNLLYDPTSKKMVWLQCNGLA